MGGLNLKNSYPTAPAKVLRPSRTPPRRLTVDERIDKYDQGLGGGLGIAATTNFALAAPTVWPADPRTARRRREYRRLEGQCTFHGNFYWYEAGSRRSSPWVK